MSARFRYATYISRDQCFSPFGKSLRMPNAKLSTDETWFRRGLIGAILLAAANGVPSVTGQYAGAGEFDSREAQTSV